MRRTSHRLIAFLLLCACDQAPAPVVAQAAEAAPAPPHSEVSDASFSEIYQVFLYRTLSPQVKAERWATRYKNRWVRWTGQLAAFTASGLKVRHLQSTVTFDVSLVLTEPQRTQLRRQLRVGGFYTYMGRLDRFDDLFRTLYLDQGVVLNPYGGSVAGSLVPTPPKLKPAPGAPDPASPPAPVGGPAVQPGAGPPARR